MKQKKSINQIPYLCYQRRIPIIEVPIVINRLAREMRNSVFFSQFYV